MYDVIVIGAGPAGLMASISAAKNKKKVLLIEKNNRVGVKLELTGGKRCNLTNLKSIDGFIKEIPVNNKFLYSTLNLFGPQNIYDYFLSLKVELKIENEDRVFPKSNKSVTIIDALYKELIKYNVEIKLNETVLELKNKIIKEIITNKNSYKTNNIIIATGGLSYSNTGSTGDGYKFAKLLEEELTPLYPAETFLITKNIYPLAGISLKNVTIKFNNKETTGSMLFTHKGISGPAVFKISEEVFKRLNNNKTIYIDLINCLTLEELFILINNYNQKKELISFIKDYLPKKFAEFIIENNLENKKIGMISNNEKLKIINILKNYEIDIMKTGSIEQSFVTGGGVNVKNINPKTMESINNKGIYFAGELLDTHGHTGGYNITIALSTGYAAGSAIK